MIVRLFRSLLRGRGGPGGSSPPVGLFLLAYQLIGRIGISNLPPATLVMMGLQIVIFMRLTDLPWSNLPRSAICLRADAIIAGEYQRLLIAPLEHVSDIHLYYNMVSFAWKGMKLENNSRYGTLGFTGLVSFFAMLTGIVYTVLSYGATELLDDLSYVQQCSIGFSGILFALKVVANNEESAELQEDFGFFTVPLRMAPWAELIIIQLLVPQASFFGHLAGIISGFIFINAVNPFSSVISLTRIIKYPITAIYSVLLYLIHMDLINKPWTSKNFWSSNTPLVCLSVNRVLGASKNYSELWRLISAPLEHSSATHFFICLVSFLNKSLYLERRKKDLWRLFFVIPGVCLATSCIYILLSTITMFVKDDLRYSSNCVQGFSGPLFAMKIICIVHAWYDRKKPISIFTLPSPAIMFELSEMMILLEKRTFLYHLAGALVGILYCSISYGWKVNPFPGKGLRLGVKTKAEINANRQNDSQLWTRSWGYASSRGMPIRRSNPTRNTFSEVNRRQNSIADTLSQRNTDMNNSIPSNEPRINDMPMQESQSPNVFTYGGERTDERDITMSPPVMTSQLQETTTELISIDQVSHSRENEPNELVSSNVRENRTNERNFRPEPSYVSEMSPPQVPAELGGGTYISEESQSEDEDESYSYSSGSNSNDSAISNSELSSTTDDMNRSSPAHNDLEELSNPVLGVDELRRRRIERFS